MRRWIVIPALLALSASVLADEELDKLLADFEKQQQAWYERLEQAREAGEVGNVDMDDLPPEPQEKFAPKFKAYAEEHVGKPEAIRALGWLLANPVFGPGGYDDKTLGWALDELTKRHADDEQIAQVLPALESAAWTLGREPIVSFCEKVLEQNKDDEARAGAMFVLGATLMNDMLPGSGKDAERAESVLRELTRKYPDSQYAKRAESYIFEIEHLQVGMKAPEIAGQSPDGQQIKLSQFAGQVVVLDFWGFW